MLSMYINITAEAVDSSVRNTQHESVPNIEKNIEDILRSGEEKNAIVDENGGNGQQISGVNNKNKGDQRFTPSTDQNLNLDTATLNTLDSSGRSEGKGKRALRAVIRKAKDQADFGSFISDTLQFKIFHGVLFIVGRDAFSHSFNLNDKTNLRLQEIQQAKTQGWKPQPKEGLTYLRIDLFPQWCRVFIPFCNFDGGDEFKLLAYENIAFQFIGQNINIARKRRYSDCMFMQNLPLLFDAFDTKADDIAPKHNFSFNITPYNSSKVTVFFGLVYNDGLFKFNNLLTKAMKEQDNLLDVKKKKYVGKLEGDILEFMDAKFDDSLSKFAQLGVKFNSEIVKGVIYLVSDTKNHIAFLNLWNDFLCFDIRKILGSEVINNKMQDGTWAIKDNMMIRVLFDIFGLMRFLSNKKLCNRNFFKIVNILAGFTYVDGSWVAYLAIQIGALYIKFTYDIMTGQLTVNISLAFYYVNAINSHLDSLPPIQANNNNLPEALNV